MDWGLMRESLLGAWATSNQATIFLIESLTPALWAAAVPGAPRRTVRMIAGHIHNARCMWIKTLGRPNGIAVPAGVDRRRASRAQVIAALKRSDRAMARLLDLACERNGRIPPTKAYVWRNLALDVGHVLTYFVAHEAHHRGQIVMLARQTGHRLPPSIHAGLWRWKPRSMPHDA